MWAERSLRDEIIFDIFYKYEKVDLFFFLNKIENIIFSTSFVKILVGLFVLLR